jgi:hypothetical protein
MSGGHGAQQAPQSSSDSETTTVQHLQTKHVRVVVEDNDEIRINISYWEECGDPDCPVKGRPPRPFTLLARRCPAAPC